MKKNKADDDAAAAKKAVDKYIELYGDYGTEPVNFIFDWRNV